MEICYTIQAEVVDITKDIPNERDAFLADTNVWYWLTYQKASQRAHPPLITRLPNIPATPIRLFVLVRESFIPG